MAAPLLLDNSGHVTPEPRAFVCKYTCFKFHSLFRYERDRSRSRSRSRDRSRSHRRDDRDTHQGHPGTSFNMQYDQNYGNYPEGSMTNYGFQQGFNPRQFHSYNPFQWVLCFF